MTVLPSIGNKTERFRNQDQVQRGLRGLKLFFFNRSCSIIYIILLQKEKCSNDINNYYQVNPLFQKYLDPALIIDIFYLANAFKCYKIIYFFVDTTNERSTNTKV